MWATVTTTPNEPVDSTTPGQAFHLAGDQWIFNIITKNYNLGSTYYFRIYLNDGTLIDFDFEPEIVEPAVSGL